MRVATLVFCCHRHGRDTLSLDFQEHNRMTTYNGLESCILNSCSPGEDSGASEVTGADGCAATDSFDDEASSFLSSKDACARSSFSSQSLLLNKQEDDDHSTCEFDSSYKLCLYAKGKAPVVQMSPSDINVMKERFSRLLLGEDVSGGTRGCSTSLALSHAIINLSAMVFGELWKLEPLSEEKRNRWHMEMGWLLSPTSYMVELIPTKQNGVDGCMLEIMTPKARSDVQLNLQALQQLDSLLLETLDSMVDTEFWYEECGSRAEDRSRNNGPWHGKKWWLPAPRIPDFGLSSSHRKRLIYQAKLVHQVLKAAKSINEQVLLQIPIPPAAKDVLPTCGKAILGKKLYQALSNESIPLEDVLVSLGFKNEQSVLDTMNRLEGAVFAWNGGTSEDMRKRSGSWYPWNLLKVASLGAERRAVDVDRAKALIQLLKTRYPNLPHTFMDVLKVQYNVDVGHAIVEAYSRVLVGLAFNLLSRMADVLLEDDLKSPKTALKFDLLSDVYLSGITQTPPGHIRRSLMHEISNLEGSHDGAPRKEGVKKRLAH